MEGVKGEAETMGTWVRFDLVVSVAEVSHDQVGLLRAQMPQVPEVGETVILRGDPYIVLSRRWGVSGDVDAAGVWDGEVWCHLRMQSLASRPAGG